MIEQAKKRYPEIVFKRCDIRSLSFDDEFDAVFSNAALHWIKESDKAAASIWNALKPGGRVVAEFGGKDNIRQIVEGINTVLDQFGFPLNKQKNPWNFLSLAEYALILENQGFVVQKAVYYDRPTKLDKESLGLRNWVEMFGSFFFEGVSDKIYEEMVDHLESLLRPTLFKEGSWYADYKRLRIQAKKPITDEQ